MSTVYSTPQFLERWKLFSLAEKISHLGSEITRARSWEEKSDRAQRDRALARALELLDITLALTPDARELAIMRQVVADIRNNTGLYACSLAFLEEYCLPFALLACRD